MNTIIGRCLFIGALLSLLFTLLVMTLFLISLPAYSLGFFWEKRLLELPFLLVVPLLGTVSGMVVGLFVGLYWRKQLVLIKSELEDIRQGKTTASSPPTDVTEFLQIREKIESARAYLVNQTKLAQKLTNERVEDQEKKLEEVVSQERNRLARELHDSVSQELFAASMMISAINEGNKALNEKSKQQMQQVEAMVQQSQLEMRALLLHLRPVPLKDKSLQEGIQQLLIELKQKVPLDISWKMDQVELARGIEDHLFRILQESVSNTLRHAKARSLDVLLLERDNLAILRVMDDGIGFHPEAVHAGSYGLQTMEERAAEIGAVLRVISVPDQGTRLEVRVPMIKTGDEEID